MKPLNFSAEKKYLKKYLRVAGVDEVGVGPLAGPVVAAAVILDDRRITRFNNELSWWQRVRDSKKLSHKRREELVKVIFKNCKSFGIGSSSVEEIDQLNVLQARLLAMKRAVESLKLSPGIILIDGNYSIPGVSVKQQCVIRGDEKILSIACASIIAKVTRDNILKNLHNQFPQYGFDKHKGYPTKYHKEMIKTHGPCDVHRKTFNPIKELLRK